MKILPKLVQVLLNDGSGTVQMTSAMRRALTERVTAYGSHHTLRCLALARRSIAPSNEQVPFPVQAHI